MTPYEIRALLHYYASNKDHGDLNRNPPIWRPTIESFLAQGLIVATSGLAVVYEITDRGRIYVEALQRVPLPVQRWVMPDAEPCREPRRSTDAASRGACAQA